jgi:hypothetical protein
MYHRGPVYSTLSGLGSLMGSLVPVCNISNQARRERVRHAAVGVARVSRRVSQSGRDSRVGGARALHADWDCARDDWQGSGPAARDLSALGGLGAEYHLAPLRTAGHHLDGI